ncbi:MAG: hypothetical protein ACR2ND_03670 [Solirubrobacteraceae bacterium]
MIYCVVPEALEDELYEKLELYYAGDPNVSVIVDRRTHERRDGAGTPGSEETSRRELRDRRRQRARGEFPPLKQG